MALNWSKAKQQRAHAPLTQQELDARALSRKASGILGERVITGRQVIAKPNAHHAKPPQVLVAQVAAYLRSLLPPGATEPMHRTMVRAENAMKRAHYPGIEKRGSNWVIRTKQRIDHGLRKQSRAHAGAYKFTGEPEPSVPPAGVQAPRG